jgi:hypothetical protein
MAIEAEDKSWMDGHYKAENDREWAKREAQWNAEAAARAALMEDVTATRLAQMDDRKRVSAIEAERDAVQVAAWRADQAAAEARARATADARRQQVALQAEYTRAQLAEREEGRRAAKQAEFLEWRLQEKAEREYQAKVEAMLRVRGATARPQ